MRSEARGNIATPLNRAVSIMPTTEAYRPDMPHSPRHPATPPPPLYPVHKHRPLMCNQASESNWYDRVLYGMARVRINRGGQDRLKQILQRVGHHDHNAPDVTGGQSAQTRPIGRLAHAQQLQRTAQGTQGRGGNVTVAGEERGGEERKRSCNPSKEVGRLSKQKPEHARQREHAVMLAQHTRSPSGSSPHPGHR